MDFLRFLSLTTDRSFLIDDHSDGTNVNELDRYWFYYDDNQGRFEYDRLRSLDPTTMPSVIDVPQYINEVKSPFSDDIWRLKDYTFTIDEEAGNKFAAMPFTLGERWEATRQYIHRGRLG